MRANNCSASNHLFPFSSSHLLIAKESNGEEVEGKQKGFHEEKSWKGNSRRKEGKSKSEKGKW